jgi:hypothetical protein
MRVINIDEDTSIGYDFQKSAFVITNKNTTTDRKDIQNALNVLNIVAPDNTITADDLTALKENLETLKAVYYTWEDTGSYIKTIQFNDYDKYPLCLSAEKSKIYIMNSTIIFDLTLNEGRRERIFQIQAFYRDTLGLYLATTDIQIFYMLLVQYYNPKCYNVIEVKNTEGTEDYSLTYNNTLKLSNYRGNSPATYSCTLNPYNQYNYNTIGEISNIEDNKITLTNLVPTIVQEGTTINLSNTVTSVPPAYYSSDGTYIVQSVDTNKIYTTENLPANFSVVFPTVNTEIYKNYIMSISRDKRTITLTNSATDYLVGDSIVVKGANIETEYETLLEDGFYTIINIVDNVLTVEETPVTDYNSTEPQAYTYKPLKALTVTAISGNTITVSELDIPHEIQIGTTIAVITDKVIQYGTIIEINPSQRQIVVDTELVNNVQPYGLLRQPIPYPNTMITIDSSKKEDVLPVGSFLVDTTEQAVEYLGLMEGLTLPMNDLEKAGETGNLCSCNLQVKDYYIIDMTTVGIDRMISKGIYSKVYSE